MVKEMRCKHLLIVGGPESILYEIRQDDYLEKVNMLGLRKSKALSIRSLDLADLLINPTSREVMGIVYSNFDITLAHESEILRFNSKYVRMLLKGEVNKLSRYKSCVPLHHVLEIFWGDLSECILEPASLMGDVWLEDGKGNISAILLELDNCWDVRYCSCPSSYTIDIEE